MALEKIVFTVTPQEAEAMLQIVGRLPTDSGAFPLYMTLRNQAEEQVKAAQEAEAPDAE